MGALQCPEVRLIEPVQVPLIPVSGIAEITPVGDGLVVATYYQRVPDLNPSSDGIEHHVAAKFLWGAEGIEQAITQWMAHIHGQMPRRFRRLHIAH